MRTCKVKPSISECDFCNDVAELYDDIPNCFKCKRNNKRYELLNIVSGILDNYAFVLSDGIIEKVSLSRVCDIKEEDKNVRLSES